MSIDEIIEFLSNFGICRPGSYDVPSKVIRACLESYIASKSLSPLIEYEFVQSYVWYSLNNNYNAEVPDHDLMRIEEFLVSGFSWGENLFSEKEIDSLRLYSQEMRRQNNYRKSYEVRRVESIKNNGKNRRLLLSKFNNKCVKCESEEHLTVDHIKPVSSGGGDEIDNLQILCRSCNSRKGSK